VTTCFDPAFGLSSLPSSKHSGGQFHINNTSYPYKCTVLQRSGYECYDDNPKPLSKHTIFTV